MIFFLSKCFMAVSLKNKDNMLRVVRGRVVERRKSGTGCLAGTGLILVIGLAVVLFKIGFRNFSPHIVRKVACQQLI